MTFLFISALLLLWMTVFLPAVLRARRRTPVSTAHSFQKRLDAIAPASLPMGRARGTGTSARARRTSHLRGQRDRRRLFYLLIAGVLLSGASALVLGEAMWEVTLALGASLALYVALLIEAKQRRVERASKVRALRTRKHTAPAASQLARRRA